MLKEIYSSDLNPLVWGNSNFLKDPTSTLPPSRNARGSQRLGSRATVSAQASWHVGSMGFFQKEAERAKASVRIFLNLLDPVNCPI